MTLTYKVLHVKTDSRANEAQVAFVDNKRGHVTMRLRDFDPSSDSTESEVETAALNAAFDAIGSLLEQRPT